MLYLIMFAIGFTGASIWAAPPEVALMLVANIEHVSKYKDHWWAAKLIQYQTSHLFSLVLCATAGSTAGSCVHYYAGRASSTLSGKLKERVERIDLSRFKTSGPALLFVSSAFSVPPYLAVCLAAGFIKYPIIKYIVPSFLGKLTRYSLAAFLGEELGHLLSKGVLS